MGSLWVDLAEIWGSFSGDVGEIVGSFWEYVGDTLGGFCGDIGEISGSLWADLEEIFGSFFGDLGTFEEILPCCYKTCFCQGIQSMRWKLWT